MEYGGRDLPWCMSWRISPHTKHTMYRVCFFEYSRLRPLPERTLADFLSANLGSRHPGCCTMFMLFCFAKPLVHASNRCLFSAHWESYMEFWVREIIVFLITDCFISTSLPMLKNSRSSKKKLGRIRSLAGLCILSGRPEQPPGANPTLSEN